MNYINENPSAETTSAQQLNDALKNIRVAMPVKVISFDQGKQTVSVQPMIKATLNAGGSIALPVLVDVPVKFPRGGGFAFTFPIASGDEGVVIINDRCIDGWYQSGDLSEPLDMRMHDLSDAAFLPGISSLPNVISDFASDSIVMRKLDSSAYLKIDQNGLIEADGTMFLIKCPIVFQNGMTGQAGTSANAISVEGNFTHTNGNLTSNNVTLHTHTHSGVQTGGGNTGGPNAS